jgi:hypothetical protein
MSYGVFHRWILVASGVLWVGLLGWIPPAGAQISIGDPIGTVIGIVGGITTTVGDTGILPAGSTDALYSEADSISTSLITADVPSARVIGYADEIASDSYLSSLNLSIGGIVITVGSVEAEARGALDGSASDGTFHVSNLSINGADVPVDDTAVNQTISIPGGQLVVNEQQVLSDGTLVVHALHVTIAGVADVVVVSAMAGPSGGEALSALTTTF